MRSKGPAMTCNECEHAVGVNAAAMHPQAAYWICGHYDVMDLDTNDGGREIGFVTTPPDWCPLTPSGFCDADTLVQKELDL